jgi:hypothetical protein
MDAKAKNGFDGHKPIRPTPTAGPAARLRLVGQDDQPGDVPVVAGGQGRADWRPSQPVAADTEVSIVTIVAALLVAAMFGALITWMVMR